VLGVLLSVWLRALLLSLLPALPIPIGLEMPIDLRVLAFAILLSVAAALFSGLFPALHAMSEDLVPGLKADSAQSGGRMRARHAFLVGQIAMSLLLVLTAGLFVRTLMRAASVPTGFDQTKIDVAMLDFSLARYTEATGPAFASSLVSRMEAEPGIEAAALAADLPLDGGRMGFGRIRTPGLRRGDTDMFNADWNVVSPGYFRTMRIGLLRGRDFSDADTAAAPGVAIVNESMARAIWNSADAIGRSIEIDDGSGWKPVTIVGVASSARVITLNGPLSPYIYVPLAQRYTPRISLLVKSADGRAIPRTRAVIRQLDVNLPVAQALPLEQITALGLIPQRIASAVAGSLGIVGLLLAAIGIYGVTSYNVNRRTREIGIRVALGADGPAVLRFIFRQGLTLTAIGLAIGLAAGALAARLLQSLLFGIRPVDPTTFIASAALFVLVALAATIGPARRAARVDPIVALRAE
jgi:predicted permease